MALSGPATPAPESEGAEAGSASASPHVRLPRQARSQQTLDRIVRAALDLIGERGVENTSIQDIVQAADSSVGSFYARFAGKEELLRYLEDQLWSDAEARWTAALDEHPWSDLSLDDLVQTVVRLLLEAYRAGARARRVLEARRGTGGQSESARLFHQNLRAGIRRLLLAHSSRMSHPDPARAIDIGLAVVVGAIREFEESPELAQVLPDMGDDERIDELARLYKAYLATNIASKGKQMDFFDIWG